MTARKSPAAGAKLDPGGTLVNEASHRDRARRARAEASSRRCSRRASCRTWRRLRSAGGLRAGRDDLPRPDARGLVDLRHRDEPRRPRHLRLHPPRPRDLPARPRPEPLRAEERLPAPQGREPPARDAGLGPALGRRDRLDRRPLPLHLSARPGPRAGCSRAWACPTSAAASAPPPSTRRADGVAPRESENVVRRPGRRRRHDRDPPDRPAASRRPAPTSGSRSTLRLDPAGRPGRRSAPAGTPRELEVREGRWSDWLRVKFKARAAPVGPRASSGSTWSGSGPTFELYASPVNFDPETPLFPISAPPDYAGELAERARACTTRRGWSRTTPA